MPPPNFGPRDRSQDLCDCNADLAKASMTRRPLADQLQVHGPPPPHNVILFVYRRCKRANRLLVRCRVRNARTAFDQHGITKLMRAVAELAECHGNLIQQCIISEGPEELKMTFAGLM